MKKSRIGIFLIGLGAAALNCVNLGGGNGSETTNGVVVGQLLEDNGSPATETRVMFVAGNHDPIMDGPVPDSLTDTTDETGRFRFRAASGAVLNIEAFQPGSGNRALITGITVPVNDTDFIPACTMQKPGAIACFLVPPDSFNGYLYIPGTTRYAKVIRGNAVIDSVPPGFISTIRYSGTVDPTGGRVVASDLTVFTGNTVVIVDSFVWQYSKRFQLNTTASGAGVSDAVFNFPALIRLNTDNFDFSQTRVDGGDLRFAKTDGTTLPYEIERWDAVSGFAEVWVKVDTVHGNDSTQSVTMYWGGATSSALASLSNGAAVFDVAAGFAGVWHLDENGDSIYDATVNAFHGTNSGTTMAAGIIGNSRMFTEGNYLKIIGLISAPSSVTLSAWVQSEKSTGGQDVISIGDAVMIRLDYFGGKGASGWYHNSPNISDDSKYAIDSSGSYLANTGWHYLTYTINSETHVQTLFIDGVQSVTINDANPIYYTGLGADTYFGIHGNGKTTYNFGGQIDEVRVSGIAESPDWVKLCYMNQKVPDALVKW